jgi:alkylhydroperoxidase family enzyme
MHFERLGAELDDDAIIELTALIAFQNLSSKFNAALNVTPQGFCDSADRPAISSKT